MSERMNKERVIEQIKKLIEFTKKAREVIGTPQKDIEIVIGENQFYLSDELLQALDIAIESLEHQVNEKDEIKLVCPKCKREWTKPIGEFCSSCGTEMVVEPYERKE